MAGHGDGPSVDEPAGEQVAVLVEPPAQALAVAQQLGRFNERAILARRRGGAGHGVGASIGGHGQALAVDARTTSSGTNWRWLCRCSSPLSISSISRRAAA